MVECFTNINNAVSTWSTLLIDVVNKHTPLKKFRSRNVSNPWTTTDIKDLMAERNYAYKIAKRSNDKEQWNNYRKNMTNRKLKSAESLYYKNLIESAVNPKEMWKSLNSVLGHNKGQDATFQVQDGKCILSEPKAVATRFNKYFANIGCTVACKLSIVAKGAWKKYEAVFQVNFGQTWNLKPVDCRTVQEILHSLKVNRAAGLDKIPARLLRDAGVDLAPSVTYLINKSIIDETVPDVWKIALVSPLYKNEYKILVQNYRPIAVLPILSKVMERAVYAQLSAHLNQLGFLYLHQYGFRRGHSTAQAIGQLNNWVLEAMDKKELTGLLFVDISKAFDSINHKILLGKCDWYTANRLSLNVKKTKMILAESRTMLSTFQNFEFKLDGKPVSRVP